MTMTASDSRLWASGVRRGPDGVLSVAGVPVTDIARDFGTPAFVLDEADLRQRATNFREAFEAAFAPGGVDVYYGGKAFLSVAVARWVHEAGLRIDVATGGELAVALRAGIPGRAIAMHGNNKSVAEIERAVEAGVGRIVIDSLIEIERIAAVAAQRKVQVPVMIRTTVGVHGHTHEFIATAHEDQKFGLSIASGQAAAAVAAVLARPELKLVGLHSHIGSQIFELSGYEIAIKRLLALYAEIERDHGVVLPEINLGGGFGVAYVPADDPPAPAQIANQLAQTLREECAALGMAVPRVSVEPGRSIIAPTVFTLYEVGTVKPVQLEDGSVRTYVSVDGGMSDNLRPALYDAEYSVTLASRTGAADQIRCRVVGKHCETGDIIIRDAQLPADITPGDLLAVPVTGAYGRAMANNYNHVPRPPVLAARDGEIRVIVRRETEADLLALDLG